MIKLFCEDCFNIFSQIEDKSIDLILCDLPYGTTACKWDSVLPLESLWIEYKRVIKDRGIVCLFGQEPFSSAVRMSNIEMYRYDWIWQKEKPSNFQLMGYQPGRVHENIMIFSKAKSCYLKNGNTAVYYPIMEKREKVRKANVKIYGDSSKNILHSYKNGEKDNFKIYEEKHPISVLHFNNEIHKVHPTQKPIELLEYLIKTYTKENDLVLDNCMGSGSTGVACQNINRSFIGIEKDEKYFQIAKERIENV